MCNEVIKRAFSSKSLTAIYFLLYSPIKCDDFKTSLLSGLHRPQIPLCTDTHSDTHNH